LLTFGGRVSQRRAGDSDVDWSKLGVGEQLLWCTPDDGKGIYGVVDSDEAPGAVGSAWDMA
jgi:hypothetical protein